MKGPPKQRPGRTGAIWRRGAKTEVRAVSRHMARVRGDARPFMWSLARAIFLDRAAGLGWLVGHPVVRQQTDVSRRTRRPLIRLYAA